MSVPPCPVQHNTRNALTQTRLAIKEEEEQEEEEEEETKMPPLNRDRVGGYKQGLTSDWTGNIMGGITGIFWSDTRGILYGQSTIVLHPVSTANGRFFLVAEECIGSYGLNSSRRFSPITEQMRVRLVSKSFHTYKNMFWLCPR